MTAVASHEITTRQVAAIRFGFYSPEETVKLSVKRITQPVLVDSLRNPVPNGLYDPALGPIDKHGRCATCTLGYNDCPGHFGHIELPVPVYNPLVFSMLYRLLRQQCFHCFHLRMDREEVSRFETKLALLCSGRLTDAAAIQLARAALPKELAEIMEDLNGKGVLPSGGAPALLDALHDGKLGGRLTALTMGAVQDTIAELFARMPKGKCRNCEAHSPNVKKMGGMRLFASYGSAKAAMANAKAGINMRSVLARHAGAALDVEATLAEALGKPDEKKHDKKGKFDTKEGIQSKAEVKAGVGDWKQEGGGAGDAADGDDWEGPIVEETVEDLIEEQQRARADEAARDRGEVEGLPPGTKLDLTPKFMTSWEVEEMVRRLFEKEWRLLALVFGPGGDCWDAAPGSGRQGAPSTLAGVSLAVKAGSLVVRFSDEAATDARARWRMFFVRMLPVAPNKFRPPSIMGETMFEHPQNVSLQRVLNACLEMASIKATLASNEQLANVVDPQQVRNMELARMIGQWAALQDAVATLIDSTMAAKTGTKDAGQGIRQRLEKKEGLFRMHMMGKRVNFAARSVISPDPYIGTGEIGVPPYFAMRLCFPERVTPWNVARLREAVIRGPHQLNGAVAVEDGAGRVVNLRLLDDKRREALAKSLLSTTEGGDVGRLGFRGSTPRRGGATMNGAGGPGKGGGAGSGFVGSNKIVYRHLQDGDLMLTNRQPTLHKPGLMAHRARVLKGEKTIRMHYANCSTFNADFDGDEINLHLPQDHFGRAEGYNIVHADHQYIVPTDGKPIRGLIQDHVVAGVLLTRRDTWLTRSEYTQLVYLACSAWRRKGSAAEGPDIIRLQPPAILKPRVLWSGKQVLSTVVGFYTNGKPPLTFSAGSKVPADYWGRSNGEAEMVFHKGELVAGCVDKNTFGKHGLVHAVQEMYGGPAAGALLSALSRLFTAFLQWHGFTCGFDDLLLTAPVEKGRTGILSRAEAIATRASAEFVGEPLPEEWAAHPEGHAQELQAARIKVNRALSERYRASRTTGAAHDMKGSGVMHPLSSAVVKACLPVGQVKPFPRNCLSLMTISGAKGSLVNFSQISCLLGQQELEGRRVPRMASGATLPCFAPYDGGARSCGFVADRFLSGLRPQEYYFHCMAGREGLIDTTVKTARSGYLQRCMVKNLETLRVHYDFTVRDSADGSVIQFQYGEDGLDVTRTACLDKLPFLARNAPRFSQAVDRPAAKAASVTAQLGEAEAAVSVALARRSDLLAVASGPDQDAARKARRKMDAQLPVLATQPPSVLGATSEAFMDRLLSYTARNPDQLLLSTQPLPSSVSEKKKKGKKRGAEIAGRPGLHEAEFQAADLVDGPTFIELMCLKYMTSLAAPGEAVGVLAAQSIGEPSTQMTLNTFHMAGRGEANVTLGIPRLREILMTAAKRIKTPVMTLPLHAGMGVAEAGALAGRMRKLRLAETLAGISLSEQPVCGNARDGYHRTYTVTLHFFSPAQYPADLGLTFSELVAAFKGPFTTRLKGEVDKEVRLKSSAGIKSVVGRVDDAALRGGDEEGAPAPGAITNAGEDEEGGAVGGQKRARKGGRRGGGEPGDEDDDGGDDGDGDDDAEALEEEGKLRFRALDDEATYDEPDEEDREVASQAAHTAARQELAGDEDSDGEDAPGGVGDKEPTARGDGYAAGVGSPRDTPGPGGPKAGKTSNKDKAAAGKTAPAAGGGALGSDDETADVDYRSHTCRVALRLPLHAPKLLMLEVVERVAAAVMVRETPGIDKVYVLPGERGEGARVQTDGVNFPGVWAHADLVDVNGITTNDVAAMLTTYGVEAARATVLREVQSVFAAYGIGVDPRHLGLIADFMTHQGGYRPCNRIGIASSVSPFLKMSFETAAQFLTDATLRHSTDDLRTPSARLCLGQVVELGTGVMGLVQQLGASAKA